MRSEVKDLFKLLDIIKIRMRSRRPIADVSADCTVRSKLPSLDRGYMDTNAG